MDDFYDRTGSSSCWKIRDAESWDGKSLRKIMIYHNFHFLQNTKMARLRELYLRCERGKPSYEGIPLSELKRYAAQRDLTPNPPATIASMKAQLEQADDKNNSFHRFLDLPPELRERIYAQYFINCANNFEKDNTKCQPPITYASRITRREALPLFYECSNFSLRASTELSRELKPITDDQRITDVLHPHSAAFFKSTSAANLGRMRSLRLDFLGCNICLRLYARSRDDLSMIWTPHEIDLECDRDRAKYERRERMLLDLRNIVLEVAARAGPLKLREGDIERMYEIVQVAFVVLYPERQIYWWQSRSL